MNAIHVEHLIKRFGPVTAVNDISLEVPEGEIFGSSVPTARRISFTMNILKESDLIEANIKGTGSP